MSHKKSVVVNITRQTQAVAKESFGVISVLGLHKRFHDPIRYYTSVADMVTDGFDSVDPEYVAVNAILSQNPRPEKVGVMVRHADDGVITVTVTNNFQYDVTIEAATGTKTTFSFTSSGAATANEITAGIVALIPGSSGLPVTAVDNMDGTFTISSNPTGTLYSIKLGANLTLGALTATETEVQALDRIILSDDSWYGLISTSRLQADVEAVAGWAESNGKLFATCSSDANIINTTDLADTTTVLAVLKAAAYENTLFIYSGLPATFPDAAFLGKQFPTTPGSSTWAYKTLAGITPDKLTATQSKNLHDKNGNSYETIGGANVTMEGTVVSGEYIDIIRGIAWLNAEIEAAVYAKKVNLPKIPHTDAGYSIIEAEITAVLQEGVTNGLLAENPAPTVTTPLEANVSSADKVNRVLSGVTFNATLAGAVHFTTIDGIVTV